MSFEFNTDIAARCVAQQPGGRQRGYQPPQGDQVAQTWTRYGFDGALYPFQRELVDTASQGNTVIHLPTGGGKTIIAAKLASQALQHSPDKAVVMLVNRVPLVWQQKRVLERHIPDARVAGVTGERKDISSWNEVAGERKNIIVIIDSIFYTWSIAVKSLLNGVSLLILDEVHHARKNSYFAKIANECAMRDPLHESPVHVIGLTASPGADLDPEQTRRNIDDLLKVTNCRIAAVVDQREDLVQRVPVPECKLEVYELSDEERAVEEDLLGALATVAQSVVHDPRIPDGFAQRFTSLNMPRGSVQAITECADNIAAAQARGETDAEAVGKVLRRLNEALLLLSDVGIEAAVSHITSDTWSWIGWCFTTLERVTERVVMVHRSLNVHVGSWLYHFVLRAEDTYLKHVPAAAAPGATRETELPCTKMRILAGLLDSVKASFDADDDDGGQMGSGAITSFRGIIFCQTKRAADQIQRYLARTFPSLHSRCFVGHSRSVIGELPMSAGAKVMRMNDKQQQDCLRAFSDGDVRVLVATSVAEEGLDIPACNLVIRYDSDVTVKSFIQTRGRAREKSSRYYAIMRRGPEAEHFRAIARAAQAQDRIAYDLCRASHGVAGAASADGNGADATRTGIEMWRSEPMDALQRLQKRVQSGEADDMLTDPRHPRAREDGLVINKTTDAVDGGTRVLLRTYIDAALLDPRLAGGRLTISAQARARENIATREAAESVCAAVFRDLPCNESRKALLRHILRNSSKAPSVRTAHVHNKGTDGVQYAYVKGFNMNDSAQAEEARSGDSLMGPHSTRVTEYNPNEWATGRKPWELLLKYCREKKCLLNLNPQYTQLPPDVAGGERGGGGGGTAHHWRVLIKFEVLSAQGVRERQEREATGATREDALARAAFAALIHDCNRPLAALREDAA